MSKTSKKTELLAPAGNFEKLEIAIHYGADAVYVGGRDFSLRNFSGNFSHEELQEAVEFARKHNVKVYVACNVFPRNYELRAISDYLKKLGEISPDSIIVADPGIFTQASRVIPHIPLHLSTQANTTNYRTALFWENLGAKRINVARELSLPEIKEIASRTSLETEAFVHGAMCIAYSGRCLLSSFMAGRESNRGMCCHPCRFSYTVMEEKRPGKYFPLTEDDRGSYIFNSKDLCMIEHIPEMIESGIKSLKIEGRMKGISYVASAVRVYREAIDTYYLDPGKYAIKEDWIQELAKISDRGYCTGFYLGDPSQAVPDYSENVFAYETVFAGKVLERGSKRVMIEVRNKIFKKDDIEILTAKGPVRRVRLNDIFDQEGKSVPFAQPNSIVTIATDTECLPNDLIRRIKSDESDTSYYYYHQNYKKYNKRTFKIDTSSVLLLLAEKLAHGSCILDVGCSSGRDLLWFKKQGFNVIGFERSPGLAELARKKVGCEVTEGDFETYDFSELSADAIVLMGSLVHVPHDKFENVLKRIILALKTRGYLLVSIKEGTGKTSDSHGRVFYLWKDEDLRNIFIRSGFKVADFFRQKSFVGTDEIWLGYILTF